MKIMQSLLTLKQHRRNYFNMKKKLLKKLSPKAKKIAEKQMLKSRIRRNRCKRRRPYPFGFEYARGRR